MGGTSSSHYWQPPPDPRAATSNDSPVDYHNVACQITLGLENECSCFPKVNVSIDCDELYEMMAKQYNKGYRMVHFTRVPAHIKLLAWQQAIQVYFSAFFRINPNIGDRFGGSVSWKLRVGRCFLQSYLADTGGFMAPQQSRTVHTVNLVNSIAENTQNGERLVAALSTGQEQSQTSNEFRSGYSSHRAVDLFFEVPSPPLQERYVYDIVLVPIHVEYMFRGILFFPEIQCNWIAHFNEHLNKGWRLIDIHLDIPVLEQMRIPLKQRRYFCRPTDTSALWIFEKPVSRGQDTTPLYEGTIVELPVPVKESSHGVSSTVDWMPVIRDMGSRGWELSCVVESHAVDASRWGSLVVKGLLFFQRPIA